jgi:outer membrane protein
MRAAFLTVTGSAATPQSTMARRSTWGAAVLLAAAVGALSGAAGAAPKVAVVDVRRAVLETEEGLRLQAALKRLFDNRQGELSNRERKIAADKAELDRKLQEGKTPQAQLQKDSEALAKAWAELQTLQADYTRDMQAREQQLTGPIITRVVGLVRKIAAERGAELILDKTAVPYFKDDLDVTDKTIQMYNSGQVGDPLPAGAPAPPVTAPPSKPSPAKPAPAAAPPPKK